MELFDWKTAHLAGDSWPALLRLRHQVFCCEQGYEVPSYQSMEWDQFDTPYTVYGLWRAPDGTPGACLRLIGTDQRYMIPELWPHLLDSAPPKDPRCWEISRLGVSSRLPKSQRLAAMAALMHGITAACEHFGIERLMFCTHPGLVRRLLQGVSLLESMGTPQRLGRFRVQALGCRVPVDVKERVERRFGTLEVTMRVGTCPTLECAE